MPRRPGSSSSIVTAASSTLITPETVCPIPETLKVSRSPSHRSLRVPALPGNCPTIFAKPVSIRRRASARPSWCGILIEIGVAICARAGSLQCGKIHTRRGCAAGIVTGAVVAQLKLPERQVMAGSYACGRPSARQQRGCQAQRDRPRGLDRESGDIAAQAERGLTRPTQAHATSRSARSTAPAAAATSTRPPGLSRLPPAICKKTTAKTPSASAIAAAVSVAYFTIERRPLRIDRPSQGSETASRSPRRARPSRAAWPARASSRHRPFPAPRTGPARAAQTSRQIMSTSDAALGQCVHAGALRSSRGSPRRRCVDGARPVPSGRDDLAILTHEMCLDMALGAPGRP